MCDARGLGGARRYAVAAAVKATSLRGCLRNVASSDVLPEGLYSFACLVRSSLAMNRLQLQATQIRSPAHRMSAGSEPRGADLSATNDLVPGRPGLLGSTGPPTRQDPGPVRMSLPGANLVGGLRLRHARAARANAQRQRFDEKSGSADRSCFCSTGACSTSSRMPPRLRSTCSCRCHTRVTTRSMQLPDGERMSAKSSNVTTIGVVEAQSLPPSSLWSYNE